MYSSHIHTATAAARAAGAIIINNLGTLCQADISEKQASDFVTRVDQQSEATIIDMLRRAHPEAGFLAEETIKDPPTEGLRWIIDPLDGTTNYIHGYPMFAVSIGLQRGAQMVAGVIYDPLRDEMFSAERGKGAWLGSRRLSVSSPAAMTGCIIATGFPFRKKDYLETYLDAFRGVFKEVGDLRRAGSAALDLAHLAAGRCDGFFEFALGPWDIAAGSLMVEEAGGVVTDFAGGAEFIDTGNVIAAPAKVHGLLLSTVQKSFIGVIDR